MQVDSNPEIRKAAILIQSLDQESANLLLGQLNQQTANSVLREVQQLNQVPVIEKENVLAEFLKTVRLVTDNRPYVHETATAQKR